MSVTRTNRSQRKAQPVPRTQRAAGRLREVAHAAQALGRIGQLPQAQRAADAVVLQRSVGNRALTRLVSAATTVQRKPHKPRVGSTVRYPATGPAEGDTYTVLEAQDGGVLRLRKNSNNNQVNRNWKTDDIWLVFDADPKDTDMRQKRGDWDGLTKEEKRTVYANAKTAALGHIKASVSPGLLNATNRGRVEANLKLRNFNKVKKGEWSAFWEEGGGRKWKFTIDMDDPLESSWQEPHVGWEVRLVNRGENHTGNAYPAFANEQGHVWLNEVPEFRSPD